MSPSRTIVFSLLLVMGFLALLAVAVPPECGFIFDGSTPLVDIDRQADSHQLRANWFGFNGVGLGTTGSTGHGSTGGSTGHGSTGGSTGHGSTGGSTGSTGGSTGSHRALRGSSGSSTGHGSTGSTGGHHGTTGTTGGSSSGLSYQIAVISEKLATNAIKQVGQKSKDANRCRSTPGFQGKPDVLAFRSVPNVLVKSPQGFPVNVWKSMPLNLTKGKKYYVVIKATGNGRTIYTNTDGVIVGVNGSYSEDDDNGFPAYKAGLIAMGIAICLLLVLLLLLILVAKGKGEDKYTTTVHRNENVDKL